MGKLKSAIVVLTLFFVFAGTVLGEEIQLGTVKKVMKETKQGQVLHIEVGGRLVEIETGAMTTTRKQFFEPGDEVLVSHIKQEHNDIYFIKEYIRSKPLLALLAIFILAVIFISGKKGMSSIVGMIISFLILFYYLLPAIVAGADPINSSLVTAAFLVPITFYISHGFNKKTTIAVVSSLLSLIIVTALSVIWIQWAKLTGFSSEEASFLDVIGNGSFDMRGILLASIIIGSLGVLDDVTISQVSIVSELRAVGKQKSSGDIFFHAMRIGQDHISSMVNTLILVYTGAALPLFLLFIKNPQPFAQVVQYEMIAEEIIRSLIGSIGIILSVPLSTYLASKID